MDNDNDNDNDNSREKIKKNQWVINLPRADHGGTFGGDRKHIQICDVVGFLNV